MEKEGKPQHGVELWFGFRGGGHIASREPTGLVGFPGQCSKELGMWNENVWVAPWERVGIITSSGLVGQDLPQRSLRSRGEVGSQMTVTAGTESALQSQAPMSTKGVTAWRQAQAPALAGSVALPLSEPVSSQWEQWGQQHLCTS